MTVLGFNDLKQWALPTGWDANELMKHSLADGTTMDVVVDDLVAGLIAQANALLNDPILGLMVHVTETKEREYRNGQTQTGMQERTEYSIADPRRSSTAGHMLPMKSFDATLGFTQDFLRKARRMQVDANIADALYNVEDEYERRVYTRFFSSAENTLATSGKDVPFVVGSGNPYIPPAYRGQSFLATHTHFDRQTNDAAGRLAATQNGGDHLAEHGKFGPWIGIVPDADRTTWKSVTGFYKPERNDLVYPTTASLAQVSEDTFMGIIESDKGNIFLHATPRLPTKYFGMFKGYGMNDQMAPLAALISPDYMFSPVVTSEQLYQFPLAGVNMIHEYGIGVNDRLNGYCCYFESSGSYVDPTIN